MGGGNNNGELVLIPSKRVNNLDELVLMYRASDCRRERNKLYKEIRQYFMHRVETVIANFHPRYRSDIISSYDLFMLRCIDNWKNNGARFTTYAYPYSGIKLKSETMEKYVKKSRRESNGNYTKELNGFGDNGDDYAPVAWDYIENVMGCKGEFEKCYSEEEIIKLKDSVFCEDDFNQEEL